MWFESCKGHDYGLNLVLFSGTRWARKPQRATRIKNYKSHAFIHGSMGM